MSNISITELSKELRSAIEKLETAVLMKLALYFVLVTVLRGFTGSVQPGYSEVVQIETEKGVVEAFALNLMEDEIGAVLLGSMQ